MVGFLISIIEQRILRKPLYQSSPITRHEIASFSVWLRCSSLQETTLRLLAPCQPKKSIDFICHVMDEDWY
jgi:hypothetical protein